MAKLTPEQMVIPKGIAPFEAALAFQLWASEWAMKERQQEPTPAQAPITTARALGPPWPMQDERPADFGERCAVALFTLIKEI